MTEVDWDRDRDKIQIWINWCAKNQTVTGTAQLTRLNGMVIEYTWFSVKTKS